MLSREIGSTSVRQFLVINERELPLEQVCDEFAELASSVAVDPGPGTPAQLVLWIDNDEFRWDVILVEGISPFNRRIRFRVVRRPAPSPAFSL